MDTIAYMKANKDKTVEITSKVINVPPSVAARAYDEQIGTFSTDGTFDPKAVAALKRFVPRYGAVEGKARRWRDVHHAVRAGEIDRPVDAAWARRLGGPNVVAMACPGRRSCWNPGWLIRSRG